jgi:hypothetical protein
MLHRALSWVAVWLAGTLVERPRVVLAQRPAEQPPVLTAFSINGGVDTVSTADLLLTLTHTIVGTRPSEYRVSHRADFGGTRWEPYAPAISMRDWYDASGPPCDSTRPSHRVTLFLQVRATLGEEVRVVDGQRQLVPARVESNVLRATACARAMNKPLEQPDDARSPARLP